MGTGIRKRSCSNKKLEPVYISIETAGALARVGRARQQFLDLDCDAVTADHDRALGHRKIVGEYFHRIVLRSEERRVGKECRL